MKSMSKFFLLLVTFFLISAGAFAADTDGDGMDDAWEKKYNLMVENPMDADLDIDGDKISNLDEFKLGTNPRSGKDGNGNSIPDDWEKFYFGKTVDGAGDPDKDGFSNADEFANGTNPTKADKKKKVSSTYTRSKPSMSGVRDNTTSGFKYITGKNKINFRDPIGDDKGPGYYTYPTNPVYVKGGFDITAASVDGSSDDTITFKVTLNTALKQEWGMAADFDVQFIQIYIDTDGVPGSGNIRTLPGLNLYMDPAHAWDKVVLISPQPSSRVAIEIMAKAKKFEDSVIIPKKIVGQGKTLIATVLKRDLGIDKDADMTKWKYQFFMQSNEGFPDKEDLLTRNVNEYKGLHRFGGGNPYWGDPEILDMLAFPAKGGKDEAALQFKILNVWESYPDPTLDVRAVVPMVWANQDKATDTKGLAADLASKMKPSPKGDKYVSQNFDLYGKMFTRYKWNLDASKENFLKNSLELAIDGKVFTDSLDFYIRFEQSKWDNTIWDNYENDTPGQNTISLQAQRLVLVNPLPTIDNITIGNYELNYSPWIAGAAWYPDRDKYKGIFIDGKVENLLVYKVAAYYPLWWTLPEGNEAGLGGWDFTYAGRIESKSLLPGLSVSAVGIFMPDYEANPLDSTSLLLRAYSVGTEISVEYQITPSISVGGMYAYSKVAMGSDWKDLETLTLSDWDGNTVIGDFGGEDSNNCLGKETSAPAVVLNLKAENILKSGINLQVQYFNIDEEFVAPGAARGDTAFGAGGFGGASTAMTADVLAMIGNQSAHLVPQANDFIAAVPIPAIPSEFLLLDPHNTVAKNGITWANDNWEGVASGGWKGLTTIIRYASPSGILRGHFEGSVVGFNHPDLEDYTKIRGYVAIDYSLLKIGRGVKITASSMFESHTQDGSDDSTIFISPAVVADIQLTKVVNVSLGYRQEIGIMLDGLSYTDDPTFSRRRITFSFNFNTPLGFIKTVGAYWTEKEDSNFAGRETSGAYMVTEWEYAF